MKYKRYRFYTNSANDPRPLVDLKTIQMPYWVSGYTINFEKAIIICYLPAEENLLKYWDDAHDIDVQDRDEITYTDRFPKPSWID